MQQDKNFISKILLLTLLLGLLRIVASDGEAVNPTQPRQCFSCEGINCQRISKQNVTSTCTDLLDICVTIFDDFTVSAKGCYLDMPDNYRSKCDKRHNPECFKCFGQLCNNKGRQDFKCIQCNDNLNCAKDTSSITPVQCPISTAPNSYCYVREFGDNKVERGCFVHLEDQLKCMKDSTCSMCLSNDGIACNSYKIDNNSSVSKATKSTINAFFTLIIIFVSVGLRR